MSSSDLPKLWTEPTNIGHSFLENKVIKKSKFSKHFIYKSWSPSQIFFTEKKIRKFLLIFDTKKWMKVQILETLRRLFMILVGLTMTWFSENFFNISRHGLMSNLIKKSWKVSSLSVSIHIAAFCQKFSGAQWSNENKGWEGCAIPQDTSIF